MKNPWYRKWFPHRQPPAKTCADDQEEADTQFSRGVSFASEGELQDYAQAAICYRQAADQGHSLAQFNLGVMYARGQGVARDEAQSVVWFEKAARAGDCAAQFNLGKSRHRDSLSLNKVSGQASESRIEAYKWFQLSAAQAYQGSEAALTTLTLGMSREEVTEGNRRAACLKSRNPNTAAAP